MDIDDVLELHFDLLEQIHYDLRYYGGDTILESDLVKVIARLPSAARSYVLECCTILSVGRVDLGTVWPARIASKVEWLVLLDGRVADWDEADRQSIIAHELAHAVLQHDRMSPRLDRSCESAACELAAAWGFEGTGTDVDRCTAGSAK